MFNIIVEGDYACFSRCEAKVERMSYSVPTPTAMEGLLKAVYWKPAIRYVIDRIVVYNPIKFICVRQNEGKDKVLLASVKNQMRGGDKDPTVYMKESISQRATLMLRDVKYGISFHFELTGIRSDHEDECDAKHASIINRRLRGGQYFKAPFLGCRDFTAKSVTLVDSLDETGVDESLKGDIDLGVMLYDLNFKDNTEKLKENWDVSRYCTDEADAVFYHPHMVDGVIDVARYRAEVKS
ncbi:MAG: type I-C CRISPR-associated protein Cas5c [Bacteroidales bacterium]|nr:type I-C CRISPR-associated protein Cas5c [Bacteroidales bacterium]